MTQYERKVSNVEEKLKAEVDAQKSNVAQWKEKYQNE